MERRERKERDESETSERVAKDDIKNDIKTEFFVDLKRFRSDVIFASNTTRKYTIFGSFFECMVSRIDTFVTTHIGFEASA